MVVVRSDKQRQDSKGFILSEKIMVTKSSLPEFQEYVSEIASIWDNHWLTNFGPKHQEFEKRLVEYLKVPYVSLFTNGHSALECALEALSLKGEVITTPFTFASTTHAIVRKGLKPVFADINPNDFTIDVHSVEDLITENTSAILPVHVYGNMCDVYAIDKIAKKYHLKVIYDAAHAFGVKKDGLSAASYGDVSMISFHATKVFNSIEGGALCFSDSYLKGALDEWKNFGIKNNESIEFVGGNSKMNEFCAAMGLCNLRHVNEEIEKRKKIVQRYRSNLSTIQGLRLCKIQEGVQENYAYMPIIIEDSFGASRDQVISNLNAENIYPRKYFYPLTSDFGCYDNRFNSADTPVAKYISDRILTLPLYAELPLNQVDKICTILIKSGR